MNSRSICLGACSDVNRIKTMYVMRRICLDLLATFVAVAIMATAQAGAQQPQPNVVFILADNVGYGDLGPYGGGELRGAPTPRIDQLAREGLRLTQYLVEPGCTPSRAALMTGQYSIRNGLSLIIVPDSPSTLPARAFTMGELFKSVGHATAIFGKWHLGIAPESLPTAHGFDEFYGIPPDISWDSATYVDTIELTHSVPTSPDVLLEKGPQIYEAVAGGATAQGQAIYTGSPRRDRQRVSGEVHRLHEAAEGGGQAVLPLPSVLDGTLSESPIKSSSRASLASANSVTS